MAKKDKSREPRHVRFYQHMAQTMAWRHLSGTAVKVWLEIGLIENGSNNGKLALSCRAIAERVGIGKTAAANALLELENAGFLKCMKASSFSQKTCQRTSTILAISIPAGRTPLAQ
jgi:GTP-sensing pleiotropic transcriptional regulator CodY